LPAGDRVRLTWESSADEIHSSAKRAAVEGGKVTPDRSCGKAPILHARNQLVDGCNFPFHDADRDNRSKAEVFGPEVDGEVEASDSRADADGI
jgi:hypothetical protein